VIKQTLTILLCGLFVTVQAQRNCGTEDYNQNILKEFPELSGRYGRTNPDQLLNEKLKRLGGVIRIPVAVHVLYNKEEEKLSDEMINSQIKQLNLDFAAKNIDITNVPGEFKDRVADCQIEFELKIINKIKTEEKQFLVQFKRDRRGAKVYKPAYEPIKFSSFGGKDAMPCAQYLNIWVGNITDGSAGQLLGYATFPGGVCEYDGVVIYYKCFGQSTSYKPYNKGRTLTHEVGHWLNLRHIGGDKPGGCGDDLISDTPPQKGGSETARTGNGEGQNFGCPVHPFVYNPDCPETTAEMFMNYMDYVNDECMNMFTIKQKDRMRSLFVEGGDRASLVNGVSENKQLFVTDEKRTDNFTPVITDFKKYFHCNPVTDTCRFAFVFWTETPNAKEYKVLAKKVKAATWETMITPNTYIKLDELGSHVLYEIKVQAVLNNGKLSGESTPYIFKLKGNNPFSKLKDLKLII